MTLISRIVSELKHGMTSHVCGVDLEFGSHDFMLLCLMMFIAVI